MKTQSSFLEGTSIEVIRPPEGSAPIRHVLLDFDGTISLIREGWPEVMVPLMVKVIQDTTGTAEPEEELRLIVEDFVAELTGKQTIYQMIRLTEEITKRGGVPADPLEYKQMYHERLMERIAGRREALRKGTVGADEMVVPFSYEFLAGLKKRGVHMYIASGTDEKYVKDEAALLGLDSIFGEFIYGAQDDYLNFSKAMVIRRILEENKVEGESLLVFGDGYVEIEDGKGVGATAVAVASDEAGRSGKPDPWKRERLIRAGADLVIPDFRDHEPLLDYIWQDRG